jgi:hypothetical protein
MARGSRARRMMGFSTSDDSPTLTECHRMLLDRAMRKYVELKDEGWGMTDKELAMARQAVRSYATVIALNEGGFYPDAKTSIKRAESMSLARINGKIERHSCGGLILVNRMCYNGHDPAKPSRSA